MAEAKFEPSRKYLFSQIPFTTPWAKKSKTGELFFE
jgi:hypothetical protein